jgi:hypothetical protein
MLYRNNFPEYLQAISIGPDPSFLAKNTTNCEFVSAFPQEIELMYDLKNAKRSSDPLNAYRSLVKKIFIYGPDLDVQTLFFFRKKYKNFPSYYTNIIDAEIGSAFEIARNMSNNKTYANFVTPRTALDRDLAFLAKLAAMLKTCKKPCNYFGTISDSIGTLSDFQRGLSPSSNMIGDILSDALHAPMNISTAIYNKVVPQVKSEFAKMKISCESLMKNGVKPFFSDTDRSKISKIAQRGGVLDKGNRFPLTGDTNTYHAVSKVYSDNIATMQSKLGDCFRMMDFVNRYNPYDPTMNASYAKRKFNGLRNGNVSSLIDINGSLAPGQYATENTYKKSLDVPTGSEYLRYEDSPTRKAYDTYNSPSGAASSAIAGGAGLDNVPTNGKIYNFDFGEVKLTKYGYVKDECPDTGSELGIGSSNNMIVPLRTIAVAPETLKSGMVKAGDVLILTCTDKRGNTFIERRQVGDTSGPNLLTGKLKFLIDEFVPDKNKFNSKIAGKTNELKISIQVADTKEPLPKWNVQEASQFAPIFLNRSDWERVKRQNSSQFQSWIKRMDTEFIKYVKWSPDDPIDEAFTKNKGC